MHLLFLTPGFPFDESDTTCIPPLQALVRELAGRPGVRVSVISLQYPYETEDYTWHGVRVYACGGSNRFLLKPQTWYKAIEAAGRINRAHEVDVIHSFWLGECTLVGRWLERKWGRPHWATLMGQDARIENSYLRLFPLKEMNVIALSDFHASVFLKNSGVAASPIIPWGIDENEVPTDFSEARDIDIFGAGSFSEVKNWPLFFRIIQKLTEKRPNLHVILAGGGDQKEPVEALRRELGLTETVKFTGPISRPKVLGWMRRSRVFLHTSHYESFGFVLTEALMSGCRVVSTPVGIAPQLPFCRTANSENELVEAVLASLAEPVLTGPSIPFSLKNCADEYLNLARLKPKMMPPLEVPTGIDTDFGSGQ